MSAVVAAVLALVPSSVTAATGPTSTWAAPATFSSTIGPIRAVSCPSANLCVGVSTYGYAVTSTDPADGASATWSTARVTGYVDPNGAPSLRGIACPSTSLCVATGGQLPAGSPAFFVTTDPADGASARWTIKGTPSALNGSNAQSPVVVGPVSCPSTALCVAGDPFDHYVVTSNDPADGATATWAVAQISQARDVVVTHASCASSSLCVALTNDGHAVITTDPADAANATWALNTNLALGGGGVGASGTGISCPTTTTCVVVDGSGAAWTSLNPGAGAGARWAASNVLPADRLGHHYPLSGVSCASADVCVAVDTFYGDAAVTGNAASGSGASWDVGPLYFGRTGLDVSCPTTTLCVGVGDTRTGSPSGGFAAVGVVSTTTSPTVPPTQPHHAIPVRRIAGTDRDSTSVAVSQDAFNDGAAHAVVLASNGAFADALAGTPLAVARGGPLLLTTPAAIDPVVETEIRRVLPTGATVYVLGGSLAIGSIVVAQLGGDGYVVRRLGGANRFATAVAVADELGDPSVVFEATGTTFADALSAGAAAAIRHGVVLLTNGEVLPAETAAYLAAHPGDHVAIGGPAIAADPDAVPIDGDTRYDTAVNVAATYFTRPAEIGFASGATYPDALAGGAHAGSIGAPIVLVPPSGALPASVQSYLDSSSATAGFVYGGPSAVGDDVAAEIG